MAHLGVATRPRKVKRGERGMAAAQTPAWGFVAELAGGAEGGQGTAGRPPWDPRRAEAAAGFPQSLPPLAPHVLVAVGYGVASVAWRTSGAGQVTSLL